MRLRVIGSYRNGERAYVAGQEIDVSDAEGLYLLRDSPGSFSEAAPDSDPPAAAIPSVDRRARGGKAR